MEYASNQTILQFFKVGGGFPEEVTKFFFMQIIYAVEYIHSKGYAHMDLKLNNIMLDEFFNIWIGDFGSVLKVEKEGLTSKKRGTQNYMAPEIKECKGSSWSQFNALKADVYSLGVCLFVLLYK